MALSHQQSLPVAVAVLVGGTLLCFTPGEVAVPPEAFASCLPVEIEAPPSPGATERKLASYLSRRYLIDRHETQRVVLAAYAAAAEVGLDPLLLLAVAAIESSFNPLAESVMGARGLMQIIPKYHREKLGAAADEDLLFDPEANMRLGARILQEYVHRTGTLEAGLQFYNGAFLDATAQYAQKVMAERLRLESVLRAPAAPREAALPASAS